MSVPFLFVNGNLTMVLNGKSVSVGSDHPNFNAIRDGLKNKSATELLALADVSVKSSEVCPRAQNVTNGLVTISNGIVYYDGKEVEQCLTDEVAELQSVGMPIEGMIKFIGRLYSNMSKRARNELLAFIKRNGLTIDSEGYLIAYKAVCPDYTDKHTSENGLNGSISYAIGNEVSMDRADVDDDFDAPCSQGLHAGSLTYIYCYGGGSDRIIIVKIDPADVVCIPKDSDCRKLRCCRLTVIGDYDGELKQTVYSADKSVEDMYDEDYEYDEDEDDFDWEGVEDDGCDDKAIDDFVTSDQVTVTPNVITQDNCECYGGDCGGDPNNDSFGYKPAGSTQAGRKFHNVRGSNGRFA